MAFDASTARLRRLAVDSQEFDFSDPFTLIDNLKAPCSASMSGIHSLHEYLTQAPLESYLNLDVAGKLQFHWANWSHTCQLQREVHAGNPVRLDALEKSLTSLKRVEVWLKSPRGTIVTSLHELYESYLDPRLRVSLFGAGGGQLSEREILYSDAGEAGPFSRLAALKWFDKHVYSLFVFRKMLLGFVPQRQFRLGSTVEAVWWLNSSPLEAINTTVHQISDKGVLFKVKSRGDFSRLIHGCESNAIVHFPMAFLKASYSPKLTLAQLELGETIPLKLSGQELIENQVWQRGGGADDSYFFIPADILFAEHEEEFVKAAKSFEQWFVKELK